jgi:predicted HTH transcriptional regulator
LWQNLILSKWNKHFLDIPIESMVYRRQKEYYKEIFETNQGTAQINLKENLKEILINEIRRDKNITIKELMERLGTTRGSINHHIDSLKKSGVIIRHGSTKSGHWEVIL